MSTHRPAARAGAIVLGAGLLTVLGAGTASAHVHANADDAAKGGYAHITFSVPNEEEQAGTTKVQVNFPADTPVATASTKPVPGWSAKVSTAKLAKPVQMAETKVTDAVTTIVWTADKGTRINPGEFQEFEVSAGPLPDNTDALVLPAIQTYDNGDVVRWTEKTPADGTEPEHPAPEIELAAAESEGGHSHGAAAPAGNETAGGGAHAEAEGSPGGTDAGSTDDTARWLGGAGLVLGALGLGLGGGAVLRNRRSAR